MLISIYFWIHVPLNFKFILISIINYTVSYLFNIVIVHEVQKMKIKFKS